MMHISIFDVSCLCKGRECPGNALVNADMPSQGFKMTILHSHFALVETFAAHIKQCPVKLFMTLRKTS